MRRGPRGFTPRTHLQAPDAAGAVLSFPTVVARDVGLRRVPGVVRLGDGDVVDRLDRPQPFTQTERRGGPRHFCQKLHRSDQEFALCAVALAYPAIILMRSNRMRQAL